MPAGSVIVTHSVAVTFEFPTQTCSKVMALLRTPNSSGGHSRSLDVFTSSSLLARGTAYPSWLVGRCQGATEGCTVLQSALRRPVYEGVVALNGHQAGNAWTRPRRRIFPSECCTWPCKRPSVSALLAGEMVADSRQPTRCFFFCKVRAGKLACNGWFLTSWEVPTRACENFRACGKQWRRRCCEICCHNLIQQNLFLSSPTPTMFRNRFRLVQKISRVLRVHGLHLLLTIVARDLGTDVAGGSRRRRHTKLGAAKGTKSQGRKTLLFYTT